MKTRKTTNQIKQWKKISTQYARYAAYDIRKDEIILDLRKISKKVSSPNARTIQLGENIHYEPLNGTFVLNHSCDPTGYICFDDFTLKALGNIKRGEELTFHYCTTELKLSAPFQCVCGSDKCLGLIRGFKFLDKEEQTGLFPLLSPYLKKWFENRSTHASDKIS